MNDDKGTGMGLPIVPEYKPQHNGWQCPVCGRCYAPAMMECYWCNRLKLNSSLYFPRESPQPEPDKD